MRARRASDVSIGVVPSQGAQASRARIVAFDPARDLALLEVEEGTLIRRSRSMSARSTTARRSRRSAIRAMSISPPRARPTIISAAAADPLGRHLLQRPADQRHHHPAPHRQYRARPFGRAVARPVRPGARRQHADHPQPGRRRALRLRRRQPRAHRLPPQAHQPFQSVTTACVSHVRPPAPGPGARRRRGARPRSRPPPPQAEQARETRERSLAEIEEMPREPPRPRRPAAGLLAARLRRRRSCSHQGPA